MSLNYQSPRLTSLLRPAWQQPDVDLQALPQHSAWPPQYTGGFLAHKQPHGSVLSNPLASVPLQGRAAAVTESSLELLLDQAGAGRAQHQVALLCALQSVQWRQVFNLLQLCPTPEAVDACLQAIGQCLPPRQPPPVLEDDQATLHSWQQQQQATPSSTSADLGLDQQQARITLAIFAAIDLGTTAYRPPCDACMLVSMLTDSLAFAVGCVAQQHQALASLLMACPAAVFAEDDDGCPTWTRCVILVRMSLHESA